MIVNALFYIIASLAITSALFLVLSNNPVNSAIAMISTFICTAAIWMLLQQMYLALMLIVIYVGAVLVMFLFVIFMLDLHFKKKESIRLFLYTLAVIIVCAILAIIISYVTTCVFIGSKMYGGIGDIRIIGLTMFDNNNLYTFELVDFILLTATITAITLTIRTKNKSNKYVDPAKQISVRSQDRLTIVKMNPHQKAIKDV